MVGHFQVYNNSIFRIFITVVTVITVATVKFPLLYCRDSNLEDSSTKSSDEPRRPWDGAMGAVVRAERTIMSAV